METPSSLPPLVVTITGAAGQIGYSLVFAIANGDAFGSRQLDLRLLDLPFAMKRLQAVQMELDDCNFANVTNVVATDKPEEAFKDCDFAVLVGAFPRKEGMTRADLLEKNAGIFKVQGQQLAQYAKSSCKVLVVGNPANTNCLNCLKAANGKIPAKNFSALTRLDQNRAIGFISRKTGIPNTKIQNVIIWGNHSKTQYPDIYHAIATDCPTKGVSTPITSIINDEQWNTSFISEVQQRGKKVIEARGASSAASAARAICNHLYDWYHGTGNRIVSMGVYSDGSYNIRKGLIFSFPVTIDPVKGWTIVSGFKFDAKAIERLSITEKELIEEETTSAKYL